MFSEQVILNINITCIVFLVVMMLIMMLATRMKGGVGWASIVLIATTVPAYLSNFIYFGLFTVIMVAYIINPSADSWLIPVLNVIAIVYLIHNVIFHSTLGYISRLPNKPVETKNHTRALSMDVEEMEIICNKVIDYLTTTKAYTNCDLTLAMLSFETGIHYKNISAAINGHLNKNFFEIVNGMRIEEAKRLLLELSTSDYTVESIYTECGFWSRSTFFMTFKKFEGTSPSKWLKKIRSN